MLLPEELLYLVNSELMTTFAQLNKLPHQSPFVVELSKNFTENATIECYEALLSAVRKSHYYSDAIYAYDANNKPNRIVSETNNRQYNQFRLIADRLAEELGMGTDIRLDENNIPTIQFFHSALGWISFGYELIMKLLDNSMIIGQIYHFYDLDRQKLRSVNTIAFRVMKSNIDIQKVLNTTIVYATSERDFINKIKDASTD